MIYSVWARCNPTWKMRPSPVSPGRLHEPEDDLFKLFNAAAVWISVWRTPVGFSATIPGMRLSALCSSASSQCLSPLTANTSKWPDLQHSAQVPRSSSHYIELCILSHLLILLPPLCKPECCVILPHHIVLSHPCIYSINPWFRVINLCWVVMRAGYLHISQEFPLPGMERTFLKCNNQSSSRF